MYIIILYVSKSTRVAKKKIIKPPNINSIHYHHETTLNSLLIIRVSLKKKL